MEIKISKLMTLLLTPVKAEHKLIKTKITIQMLEKVEIIIRMKFHPVGKLLGRKQKVEM